MSLYPALDVFLDLSSGLAHGTGLAANDADLMLAIVDDFQPTAAEERDGTLRVFFSRIDDRDRASHALAQAFPAAQLDHREIDDEDWARRSQDSIGPVTVGRVTVAPPNRVPPAASAADALVIVQPSMGFGTGHHATTRLCLAALQQIDLANASVLDVGTGSGVLAIAASRLGAACAIGIDNDADAIQSADENLALNGSPAGVTFEQADATVWLAGNAARGTFDVVLANLTGAALIRLAPLLQQALRPAGVAIASGFLLDEEGAVAGAFGGASPIGRSTEEEWGCAAYRLVQR